MPWTLQGELTTEWTAINVQSPYVKAGYVEPGYFEDEEWTVEAEPDDTWTLVP